VVARGAAFCGERFLTEESLTHYIAESAAVPPGDRFEVLKERVAKLNGSWALAVQWPDGEAVAAVDRLQTIPLFYGRKADGGLVIANNTADLSDCENARVLDEEAAIELLHSGYVMGCRTLRRGVCRVEPGGMLHWKNHSLTCSRHYRFLRTGWSTAGQRELTDQLDAVMHRVFARWVKAHAEQRIIVPLSGGLDSRLILAMLKLHGHPNLLAINYGRPGGIESNISYDVAKALGVPWKFFPYEDGEWHSLMVSTTMRDFWRFSGQDAVLPHIQDYLALHKLRYQEPKVDGVFFAGMVGDMIAGVWVPDHFVDNEGLLDIKAVCSWLFYRKYAAVPVLRRDRARINHRMMEFFSHVPFSHHHNSAAAFDLFEFENRQARYIGNSVRSFEFYGYQWRLPLCDHELIEFFLSVPTQLRELKRLYALWMRDRVFVGTLAPLADIPPVGDGRCVWYGEPREIRHDLRQNTRRLLASVYHRWMPSFLQRLRSERGSRRFIPHPLRFNAWFAQNDAESRRQTVGDLMDGPGGLLCDLPPFLRVRVVPHEGIPLCHIDCLVMLSAVYLADLSRHLAHK